MRYSLLQNDSPLQKKTLDKRRKKLACLLWNNFFDGSKRVDQDFVQLCSIDNMHLSDALNSILADHVAIRHCRREKHSS